jgi:hypothetical protein
MARKSTSVESKPTLVPTESPATNDSINPFADFALTTLTVTKKYGTRMSNEDRRTKLIAALLDQRKVYEPGHVCTKTKNGKDRKESWVKGSEGSFVFFVKYGHSELELAPGMKGVSVSKMSDVPAIIDRVVEVVKTGYFDAQMKEISETLSKKIQDGKSEKIAAAQQKAA